MAPTHHPTSLQIPQMDPEMSSSRHNAQGQPPSSSQYRPASVAVHSANPASPNPHSTSSAPRRQQRASHSVVSGSSAAQEPGHSRQEGSSQPDVYAHPAAVAYAAAHPRRPIPRFGPYLLLQTLGEGEFGKVKLGLHCQWGEEVAVKLIRRGNIDSTVRMSKVEREIEVLRALKHPNIVRLYDVIETDKYIGIILEYASGGELFDHILAHRYLREKDAAKLFSQLISGVWYIHQKKIVHRDLKLENLLLDRHRNVIITDFGFANRFEHRADDLMQTSCGSPCYAAPELVISEGLYVGSAVDIWSCGVILYAMLAGYLPFDDDPANPDGDNINLLYKYIVNTPLSFPEYVSEQARDLLSLMLVPDPTRRANLDTVMRHSWLAGYHGQPRTDGVPNAFGKSLADLEKMDLEQRQAKRQAYRRQIRAQAAQANEAAASPRTQSHRPEGSAGTQSTSTRSRSNQPEYLYDSSNGASGKTFDSPAALGLAEDDPFGPPPSAKRNSVVVTTTTTTTTNHHRKQVSPIRRPAGSHGHRSSASGGGSSGGGGFRHTIQVEYDDKNAKKDDRRRDRSGSQGQTPAVPFHVPTHSHQRETPVSEWPCHETSSFPAFRPTPSALRIQSPSNSFHPQESLLKTVPREATRDTQHQSKAPSPPRRKDTKKGKSSLDKLGLGKIFGNGSTPPPPVPPLNGSGSHLQSPSTEASSRAPFDGQSNSSSVGLASASSEKEAPAADKGRKSRRNTLTVMVEPFLGTMRRNKAKGAATPATPTPADGSSVASGSISKASQLSTTPSREPQSAISGAPSAFPSSLADSQQHHPQDPSVFQQSGDLPPDALNGMHASTSKARKVMQWFRTKSKGRESAGLGLDSPAYGYEGDMDKEETPTQGKYKKGFSASSNTVNQMGVPASAGVTGASPHITVTQPPQSASAKLAAPGHPVRSASTAHGEASVTPSFVARFRNSVTVGGGGNHASSSKGPTHTHGQLRIHHGAVDQTTITTRPPPEVMAHVKKVLETMGVEIQLEHEYKYRCIRAKKKKGAMAAASSANGQTSPNLAAVQMSGSAASNGVDKRGLPLPSPSAFSGTGGMLRGLLMRRQSSQVSSVSQPTAAFDEETSVVASEPLVMNDAAYGDPSQDAGDEVRFSVELTRIDRLNDTYSLDVRRLKGNLRSYKYLYDTIRQRADLQS
ncbi:Pkinase-domain-containing protein [Coprinellus micaceus]|uniref:non-specific serine/threonine protein kinase n=1 Tax=Coprinellus micaceus TaxID=71717 RepID=A0A4Y7THK4_COPMI|nr:Pkinase-domain-containing protein [Coprinellus micaceus]